MDSEKILPSDMRFETHIGDYPDELIEEIDRIRDKEPFRDIVDVDFELEGLKNMEMMASLAYWVNEAVVPDSDRSAYETMYRAATFANQVSKFVHDGEVIAFNASEYLEQLIPQDDSYEQLIDDITIYLDDNPNIGELLDHYCGELDGGRGHADLAEIMGGLVFMLIERSKAERFLAED